jgi:antitoxin component YwqK of YwqJK toxin-antitoxin module
MKFFVLFLSAVFLNSCTNLNQENLKEYSSDLVTIPNDSIAYFKKDMTLVTGIVVTYYNNDSVRKKATFRKGKKHGVTKEWSYDGQLKREEHYKDGLRHGKIKEWDLNGQLRAELNIIYDSILDGPYSIWNNKGKLIEHSVWDNNVKISFKEWRKNGNPVSESQSDKNGDLLLLRHWHENGQLSSEYRFKNEKLHGKQLDYLENGQLIK